MLASSPEFVARQRHNHKEKIMHKLIIPVSPRINPVHYRGDACLVVCFDQNFQGLHEEKISEHFRKTRGWQWIDPVETPGGGKSFSSPSTPAKREALFTDVDTSMNAHGTKRIIVSTHEQCAAYGPIFQQGGRVEEFKRHIEEHRLIRAAILERYGEGGLDEIIHLYASCDGVVELDLAADEVPAFLLAA